MVRVGRCSVGSRPRGGPVRHRTKSSRQERTRSTRVRRLAVAAAACVAATVGFTPAEAQVPPMEHWDPQQSEWHYELEMLPDLKDFDNVPGHWDPSGSDRI